MENVDTYYKRSYIPYRIESKVTKRVKNYFQRNNPKTLNNGKTINIDDEDVLWKIEQKIQRIAIEELTLVLEKMEEDDNGDEWGVQYLFGGERDGNQLILISRNDDNPDLPDRFTNYLGNEMF